jgi:serine O-acetyltransferase
VIVGAGAKVLGGFTVGEYAKVGSNAVLLKPVPPGATAVGNPAHIVRAQCRTAGRDQAAARLFAAYGVMPNGDDPLSKALHGLINQVAKQEQQLEAVLAALKGAGIGCRRLEEAGQLTPRN